MTKHSSLPWEIQDPMCDDLWIVEAGKEAFEWRCIASVQATPEDEGPPLSRAEMRANANLIITAVNNHAPMLKTLKHCAALFDTLAVKLDRWAAESRQFGWSTHQVDENRKTADDCRRYAGHIRAALPQPEAAVGGTKP